MDIAILAASVAALLACWFAIREQIATADRSRPRAIR
jgi:hypothetical protein